MAENFVGITHTGRVRDNNEDTYLAEKLPNGWIVACVIDGVGGYEGGEVAAEIARETIRTGLKKIAQDPLQTLREALLQANKNIYEEKMKSTGKEQMACVLTIALVDVSTNQFYYAHVGDTRLYLLRDQTLVKVTKDHSFVGFLEDSGRLSEVEAMQHPKRNEINKALGFDPQIDLRSDYIETGQSPFLSGDALLLCSDGLSDLVDRKAMTAILVSQKALSEKGQALIDAANGAGGKDNITVVLVSNNKKQARPKATKPVLIKKSASDTAPVPVVQAPVAEEKKAPPPAKKSNPIVTILSVLCLLLAATAFYLWWRGRSESITVAPVAQHTLGDSEKKLNDSLSLANHSLFFSEPVFGKNITVSDTIFVRQDTLHINGNGATLVADSAFAGPALMPTVNNKFLSLENIVFKNFATAIVLQGKGIQLKNVQFINCKVPVQRQVFFATDSAVSGTLKDTFILSHNSLPK